MHRGLFAAAIAMVVLGLLALRPAGGQGSDAPWIIEPTPEAAGAVAAGAAEVKRAQKLAKKKKFGEVVTVLEAVAQRLLLVHPPPPPPPCWSAPI